MLGPMAPIHRILERAVPALLMAASVVLLSAGIFAFAPPIAAPGATASLEPGAPIFTPSASGPTFTPSPSALGGVPSSTPFPFPTPAPRSPTASPTATPLGQASPAPVATARPTATARPAERARATRIVVPSLNIDLAVVPGDLDVRGNRDDYPLCDVAQYLTTFSQPGEHGTTYIYAHARRGMFLPLLNASERNNGASMIGSLVEVYTSDNLLYLYEISVVKRHATDLSLAFDLPPGGQQLVLQTSEGPPGTIPKLQVAALPISVVPAEPAEAGPVPRPRACPP